MILEIRLSNFFSIKEEIVLDMQAGKINTEKSRNLTHNLIKDKDLEVLKTVALYGANASGKSNIIKALRFCASMVFNSHTHNENSMFNFKPFKFDGWQHKPSSFFINFIMNDVEYEYSFSLTQNEILTEELYRFPRQKRARVFTRDERTAREKKEVYSFGTALKKPMDVAENTSRKTLFVSRASQMDREIPKEVFQFFFTKFILGYVGYNTLSLEKLFKQNKDKLLKALQVADSDIMDIKLRKEIRPVKNFNADLTANTATVKDGEQEHLIFTSYHRTQPGVAFDFNLEESEGTRKLFYIMLTILDIINNGKILLIDEIDSSLHSKIVEYILRLFHAGEKAQLIFTTHNTNLLDLTKLRKDQIYFVNKKADASTDLYSLFDYKDFRERMDLEKAYLQGRFDAIPYVNDSSSNLKSILDES